jgi:hypothetical protein
MLSKKAVIRSIIALMIIGATGIVTLGEFALAAVNLVWFKATAGDGEVLVEWLTHSEIDNAGFNLYRTTSEGGPYTRINDSLIPGGDMGTDVGGYYAYTDNDVFSGITYYYILESVATDGFTELYGPASATLDGQPTATPSPTPIWGDITDVRMSDTPGGPEMTQFPSETSLVYVVIDYYEMHGERYRVRVYDNAANILLEQVRAFTGSGTESIEVPGPEGRAFPDGRYVTNLYTGMFPILTLIWEVSGPPKIRLCLPLIVKDDAPLPSLKGAHMSDTPYGPAVINFPSGVGVVYTILEYENLRETLLGVRAYDNVGNVLFEQMKQYSGSGVESVRIASETGVFADGRYVTNIYIGMTYRGAYPFLAKTLLWAVGEEWQWPTATFTPEVPVVTATPVPPTNTPLPTPTATVIPARTSHSLSRDITLTILHSVSTAKSAHRLTGDSIVQKATCINWQVAFLCYCGSLKSKASLRWRPEGL